MRSQHGLPPPLCQLDSAPAVLNGNASIVQSGTAGKATAILTGVSLEDTVHLIFMSTLPAITVASQVTSTMVPLTIHHPAPSGTVTTCGHLALFNQLVNKEQKAVEWKYTSDVGDGTHTTPIWSARVEVDGEEYGKGKGGTKKAARNEAAKEGLSRMGVHV